MTNLFRQWVAEEQVSTFPTDAQPSGTAAWLRGLGHFLFPSNPWAERTPEGLNLPFLVRALFS